MGFFTEQESEVIDMYTVDGMKGKTIEIDADTPLCCDPSTETYWSM